MVETPDILASSHVKVPYRSNQIQRGLQKNRQDHQKPPKTAKWVIFKGDGSLDALFSRFWERFNVFWIPHMSGYLMDLMKPIRDNEDFKGAVRNVKNGPKRGKKVKWMIFKGDGSLDTLFPWFWERLKLFWTPHMSG